MRMWKGSDDPGTGIDDPKEGQAMKIALLVVLGLAALAGFLWMVSRDVRLTPAGRCHICGQRVEDLAEHLRQHAEE